MKIGPKITKNQKKRTWNRKKSIFASGWEIWSLHKSMQSPQSATCKVAHHHATKFVLKKKELTSPLHSGAAFH